MVGWIAHQHHMGKLDDRWLLPGGGAEATRQSIGFDKVLAEAAIAQQQGTVVVSGQEPAAERRFPYWCNGTQPVESWIWIGQKGWITQIELRRC